MDDDTALFGDGGYGDANSLDDLFNDLDGSGSPAFFNGDTTMFEPSPAEHDTEEDLKLLKGQDTENNNELGSFLNEGNVGADPGFDINELNERELERGEKADDAVDYEDIDDDDLPDEETPQDTNTMQDLPFLSAINDSAIQGSDEVDDADLFGDDDDDDDGNVFFNDRATVDQNKQEKADADSDLASDQGPGTMALLDKRDDDMTEEEQRMWRLQNMLLSRADDVEVTSGPADLGSWLQIEFPGFDRNDPSPFWNRLLPPKPGKWQGKEPKKSKPIRPTKVTLDIEPDQKALFTAPPGILLPFEKRKDLVRVDTGDGRQDPAGDVEGSGTDEEDDLPLGLSMQELDLICTDFDTLSQVADNEVRILGEDEDMLGLEEADEFNDFEHSVKKRRLGLDPSDIALIHHMDLPSFDDPEKLTAKLARQVILDLNDSALLVEEVDSEALRTRSRFDGKKVQTATLKERLAHRFKTSNDAAYSLLQGNRKKVRGQLSSMNIDHSAPAVRLQYPYYKVRLTLQEMRNYHRHKMIFKAPVTFSKVHKVKRKEYKNKPALEAYAKTRDLSIADNSYSLLLEYSEEHPIMLSGIGMGNKIVNYYRKLDANDASRPKTDIGDTSVLMPEDKSPFANFGHVDPGQQVLSLYNSMYRAPIFDQAARHQDFLLVRETTGLHGSQYYLRNLDFMYVVGQELPNVVVPGTHSRMVTTASKNRLRAISYRIARKKKSHRIRVEEVTRHFPDTNDMQNRQKMKEFMQFNKDHKEWEIKNGEALPNEEEIQKLLKPEDVCLLESMQVGSRYLEDAGYADNDEDDEEESGKKSKEGPKELPVEQQLAPWRTTKNFIQATQGKAMLRLYGEGDPSGRGEAFSLLKTSMKGGFQPQGASTNENVDRMGRDKQGHTYNVARQQKSYDDSIRAIWDKQRAVLTSKIEPDDEDDGIDAQLDDRTNNVRATPISGTPGNSRRRDDETGTSFSRRSGTSQAQKYLRIVRKVWDRRQDDWVDMETIETDPAVIKQYLRHKELDEANIRLDELAPTGDVEVDARQRRRLEEQLARLEKNKIRRARKNKSIGGADASPPPGASGESTNLVSANAPGSPGIDGEYVAPTTGSRRDAPPTQRKCANCGRIGHIKTNKKLCPLLNGEIQQDTGVLNNAAFMGAPPTL